MRRVGLHGACFPGTCTGGLTDALMCVWLIPGASVAGPSSAELCGNDESTVLTLFLFAIGSSALHTFRERGAGTDTLWLAREIGIHQNCPLKKKQLPLSPALNSAWPEVGCDPDLRDRGPRHQGKSTTPDIFSLERMRTICLF